MFSFLNFILNFVYFLGFYWDITDWATQPVKITESINNNDYDKLDDDDDLFKNNDYPIYSKVKKSKNLLNIQFNSLIE